jgi:hypothetical protein
LESKAIMLANLNPSEGVAMGLLDFFIGTKKTAAGIPAKRSAEVREALLAVNRPALPFIVRDGSPEKVDLVAEWQIVDAIWCKVFAKAALDKTFKILMRLDADKHEVRAVDQAWSVEWRSGTPRLSLSPGMFRWHNAGSTPVQLTVDTTFDFLVNSSATNQFAFTEDGVKSPLREAVTAAGWTWRDVALGSL